MPRKAREKAGSGIYHLMMRGNNHQRIFDDECDMNACLRLMKKIAKDEEGLPPSIDCRIYAYVLMENHLHILVRMMDGEIGVFAKAFASSYATYYNRRHNRDGHLFKGRFASEPCEDLNYLLTLICYIHLNPVKAKLVQNPQDYKYSSWIEYLTGENICCLNAIFKATNLKEINELMGCNNLNFAPCIDIDKTNTKKLNDLDAEKFLSNSYGLTHPSHLMRLSLSERKSILIEMLQLGFGIRQLERLTGIDKNFISRLRNVTKGTGDLVP